MQSREVPGQKERGATTHESWVEPEQWCELMTFDWKIIATIKSPDNRSLEGDCVAMISYDFGTKWLDGNPSPNRSSAEAESIIQLVCGPGNKPKLVYTDNGRAEARVEGASRQVRAR